MATSAMDPDRSSPGEVCVPLSDAGSRLPELAALARSSGDDVVLTEGGAPVAALVDFVELQRLRAAALAAAVQEAVGGLSGAEFVPHGQAMASLGLKPRAA